MPHNLSRLSAFLVVLAILLITGPMTRAEAAAAPPLQDSSLSDAQELERFMDGLAAAQLAAYPVAGMTVSVVKDGELFFAKGYGYADVEDAVPVSAEETLFRAGSVSKLLVWTAMMQLVERGELDLDADVNSYLDFEIPPAFGAPITLRNLMTHTPGFEDQGLGLFVRSEAQIAPLDQYLAQNVPERVFPPGELAAYSNYGASLTAYIVQRVSGVPFYEYVEENIFAPLGMAHSTLRQPPPAPLAANVSKGYAYRQGRFQEQGFEFLQSYPAGALSTTAGDMGRFMIAHLQNGRLGQERILQEETARSMRELAFAHDPRLPGWGAGFTVSDMDGRRVVGHGGDTTYFHSELILLPEENVGLFISTNTDRGIFARFHMMQAFLERYFLQDEGARPEPPPSFEERAGAYSGAYFPARMNFSSLEKLLSLLQPVQVQATEEGLLMVTGVLGSEPTYWAEQSPHLFTAVSENLPADSVLLFRPREEEEGQMQYVFFQQSAYIRQPAYAAPSMHYLLLGLNMLFFLGVLVAVPAGALVHRRYRQAAPAAIEPRPAGARLAGWLAWVLALLNLAFLLIFFLTVSDLSNVVYGLPPYLQAVLVVPWLSVLLWLAVAVFTGLAWMRGYWTQWGRLGYSLFVVLSAGYLWFLVFWNLL